MAKGITTEGVPKKYPDEAAELAEPELTTW
jgi:hypothetical protein